MRDNGLAMGFTAADLSRLDSLNMLPAHSFGKVTPPSRHRGFAPRISQTEWPHAETQSRGENIQRFSTALRRETFFSG